MTALPRLTRKPARQPLELPDAACRGHDPEMWSEPDGAASSGIRADADPEQVRAANQVCATCPARIPCGTWAIEHEEVGIWGGMTRHERKLIRAQIQAVSA